MISTLRKINAILSNSKINRPKLVDMCGCKLVTNPQKFHGNILSPSENIAETFMGLLFWLTRLYTLLWLLMHLSLSVPILSVRKLSCVC